MEATIPLVVAGVAALLLTLGALFDDRRNRARRFAALQPPTASEPPLVHSINDDRCIGCEACVDVCPTSVLDLVDHKARVLRFGDCVQCEQCMNVCPTTALVMHREGAVPQTLTVPEIDERFQTGIPGQYLIGEVAGKPLVKNAANLGRAVIEHISRELGAQRGGGGELYDVVVVGSGPAGLSAGLTCLHQKLSCVVLEKEHVIASTVARYPKGKLFMAEPVNDRNVSFLPVFDATKEELVSAWQRVVDGVKLPVKLGESVETVKRGDDGIFTIKTTVATYRSKNVVLATGLRGKPRLLAVPGANLEKVRSRLDDPDQHAGEHVLVVGGGDSAVEAAIALSDVAASVVLSYRGDGFKRCKAGNQKRLAAISADNKIEVLLGSNIKEFTADEVSIQLDGGEVVTRPNQRAFVLIGADTPVAWLEANQVKFIERPHLYALGSTEETVRRVAPDAGEGVRDPAQAIAMLLGKAPARPSRPPNKLRSVVTHIRDEFRDAVTSVSGVFKLPVAPPPARVRTRTPPVGSRTAPAEQPAQPLIPAANLVKGPRLFPRQSTSTRADAGFGTGENTMVGYVVARATAFDLEDDGETLPGEGATAVDKARPAASPRAPSAAVATTRAPTRAPSPAGATTRAPTRAPSPAGATTPPRAPTKAGPSPASLTPAIPLDPREFDDDDAQTLAEERASVARRRPARGTPELAPGAKVVTARGTDEIETSARRPLPGVPAPAPARPAARSVPPALSGLPVPQTIESETDETGKVIVSRKVVSG